MSRFVFLYRMPHAAPPPSPREMQQRMEKWMAWMKGLEAAGHVAEGGEPLAPTGSVVGEDGVSDGPYAEAKDIVMGFSIIEASDLAEAQRLAAGCPIVPAGGGVVEVRPVRPRLG